MEFVCIQNHIKRKSKVTGLENVVNQPGVTIRKSYFGSIVIKEDDFAVAVIYNDNKDWCEYNLELFVPSEIVGAL